MSRPTEVEKYDKMVQSCERLTEPQKKFMLEATDEQKRVVLYDSGHILAESSAGSGKTRTLISEYLFLTRVRKVDPKRIHYLSFNKKNVEDSVKLLCGKPLKIREKEAKSFASTFHSLALKIVADIEGVWPVLLEPVYKAFEKESEIDHDKATVFLRYYTDALVDLQTKKGFKKHLSENGLREKKGYPQSYVTSYTDSAGVPGSCRSYTEKKIFEYLAQNGYRFKYERRHGDNRPDFTISSGGEEYIYEHFALPPKGKKSEDSIYKDYCKNVEQKEKQYKDSGVSFFYTTGADPETGKQKPDEDILAELSSELEKRRILSVDNNNCIELSDDVLLSGAVKKFKSVRSIILETGQDIPVIQQKMMRKRGYPKYFFKHIFNPLEDIYSKWLSDNNCYTDFTDSLVKAVSYCNNDSLRDKLKQYEYDILLIDEFQDISPLRHSFIKALSRLNPNMRIIAVGDDWQSIYNYSSSDIHLFKNFKRNWQNAITTSLSETFRFSGEALYVSTKFAREDGRLSRHRVKSNPNSSDTKLDIRALPEKDNKYWLDPQIDFVTTKIKNKYQDKNVLVLCRAGKPLENYALQRIKRNHNPQKDLDFLTIHKAKGKTADIVFIIGCNEYENEPGEYEKMIKCIRGSALRTGRDEEAREERRVFYVALTRAKEKVYILYSENRPPLSFIKEIQSYKGEYESQNK